MRYSPDGGAIHLRCVTGGGDVEIAVCDQGVGVPPGRQRAIFERFGRGHGSRYGGLGLGLTIAEGIVLQHGGRIWVESDGTPGHGSTFRVRLPAHPTAPTAPTASERSNGSTHAATLTPTPSAGA